MLALPTAAVNLRLATGYSIYAATASPGSRRRTSRRASSAPAPSRRRPLVVPLGNVARRFAAALPGYRSAVARALLALVLAAVAADTAAASAPPAHPLAFDPARGSLAGVRLGDPMAKLVRVLGPADTTIRLADGTPVSLWLRDERLCSVWAEAAARSRQSSAIVSVTYLGPVASPRGDRTGTPLATVRLHWKTGWHLVAKVIGARGPNYGRLLRDASAAFGFDEHRRLAGVALRASAQIWQPIVFPRCS